MVRRSTILWNKFVSSFDVPLVPGREWDTTFVRTVLNYNRKSFLIEVTNKPILLFVAPHPPVSVFTLKREITESHCWVFSFSSSHRFSFTRQFNKWKDIRSGNRFPPTVLIYSIFFRSVTCVSSLWSLIS